MARIPYWLVSLTSLDGLWLTSREQTRRASTGRLRREHFAGLPRRGSQHALVQFGVELTYKDPTGHVANTLLYRQDEPRLEVVDRGRPWSFDGAGGLFRLVSEAHRIRLAHLFDPVLAVHTSLIEPLPHQITAVYDAILPRQPLRFFLAAETPETAGLAREGGKPPTTQAALFEASED